MEKIFQILAVFVLLMLVITRFIRDREFKFREYIFLRRIRYPLPADISQRLLRSWLDPDAAPLPATDRENSLVFRRRPDATGVLEIVDEENAVVVSLLEIDPFDALLFDPGTRLIYCCSTQGAITIVRQSARDAYQVLQLLAVPLNGELMALDPAGQEITYVGSGEYFFVFSPL